MAGEWGECGGGRNTWVPARGAEAGGDTAEDVLSLLHSLCGLRASLCPTLGCIHAPSLSIMASGALALFGLARAGPPSAVAGPQEGGAAFCLLLWARGPSWPPRSIQTRL